MTHGARMTGGRIAEAGVYPDVPMADYVADPCPKPSLSSSVANVLVNRTPAHAKLKHARLTPVRPAEKFSDGANFGSVVAALALGGQSLKIIEAGDWKTKDARKQRDEALAENLLPLLIKDYERAKACAMRAASMVDLLTDGRRGKAEETLVWEDEGVWCRCRPDSHDDLRTIIDLKVTQTDPIEANRQFFSQAYDMQAAFYERGADALDPGGRGRRRIFYLFIEDEPPFLAKALPISEATLVIARKRFIAARNLWRTCLDENHWPLGPLLLPASDRPNWQETKWLERELTDETIQVEDAA